MHQSFQFGNHLRDTIVLSSYTENHFMDLLPLSLNVLQPGLHHLMEGWSKSLTIVAAAIVFMVPDCASVWRSHQGWQELR